MGAASNAAADAGLPLLPGLLHPDRWLLWLGLLFIASVYFFRPASWDDCGTPGASRLESICRASSLVGEATCLLFPSF